MYIVTRGHFRSRDKDGGHTIRSAIAENLMMLHADFTITAVFYRTGSIAKFYIARIGIFARFAPVTFTLTRWPS